MTPHRPLRALRRVAGPAALALALTAAVPALTGCDPAQAGAAALVGGYRISEQQVQTDASDVLDAVDQSQGEPIEGGALLRATVQRLVVARLATVAAVREGITVTPGEVDQIIEANGGRDAVTQTLAQRQGVPASDVDAFARTSLQLEKVGVALAPAGTPEQQSTAAVEYLTALSEELGVDISTRYGAWDSAGLSVVPAPDDLSEPASAD